MKYTYMYSRGYGVIRFSYQSKTLFLKDLYDCHIDLDFIRENAGEIDKLVIYNVEKNAQFYNISKEKLPFIKECYYLDSYISSQCSRGIFTFDKVYATDPALRHYSYKKLYINKGPQITEISKEDFDEYSKLSKPIINTTGKSVEYQLEDTLE